MRQWVKNLTAVVWVATEAWFDPWPLTQWVKGSGVATAKMWLRFNPWPRNFHKLWVRPFKKKKKGEFPPS